MDECDIFQFLGLGVSQAFLPVLQSIPINKAFPPVAIIAVSFTINGH